MADRLYNRPSSESVEPSRSMVARLAIAAAALFAFSGALLLASNDPQAETVRTVAVSPALPDILTGHGGPVMGIAADPETGRLLTASFDYSVILWRLDGAGSGKEGTIVHRLIGHNAAVNDVKFVPGENKAISVSDDGAAIIWDLAGGKLLRRLQDTADKVLRVAVSNDGRLAAIARWDGTARLIDLGAMDETRRFQSHRGNVNAVAFNADATTLYTGSYDGTLRSWNTATGEETALIVEHGWGINVIALAGDALVFGALDGTLAYVDLQTGESRELVKTESPVLSLAVSGDGARLASGDGEGNIRVFETQDWSLLEEYGNPNGPVWGLAFADPEGDTLYHGGLDDFAVLWRVEPRQAFEQPKTIYPRRFQQRADLSAGELQFQRKCSICHTLSRDDGNRAGPTLFGVFGRRAGSLPGYPYSEGLRKSNIVWDEETIARLFDHGPDVVTPGTKMPIQRLKNPADRDALIEFLKSATATDKAAGGAASEGEEQPR